jgi:hypothetical protein
MTADTTSRARALETALDVPIAAVPEKEIVWVSGTQDCEPVPELVPEVAVASALGLPNPVALQPVKRSAAAVRLMTNKFLTDYSRARQVPNAGKSNFYIKSCT